jgi:kynurenine formamidase
VSVIDLLQPYFPGMPHGTTIPAPSFREARTLEEHGLRRMELTLPIHLGTHLDAPSPFVAGARRSTRSGWTRSLARPCASLSRRGRTSQSRRATSSRSARWRRRGTRC